ncbi:MAG: DUF4360 domain-containing protein [Geminicoccaceae bacterium]
MKPKILALTAAAVLASVSVAEAQVPGITLGLPETGGTGCPAGTVSAVLAPDARSLSIFFDAYFVEAGGTTGRSFERKSCNVGIPVNVPQGLSVSVIGIDYRGFNSLPLGGLSQFNVEYFFAGTRGPTFSRTFRGPLASDYLIHNDIVATALVWSACGADVILRTNSSIRVQTTANRDAMATVDTEDIDAALIYLLQWRQCN